MQTIHLEIVVTVPTLQLIKRVLLKKRCFLILILIEVDLLDFYQQLQ